MLMAHFLCQILGDEESSREQSEAQISLCLSLAAKRAPKLCPDVDV